MGCTLEKHGPEMVNWPLHSMVNHVPEMMRFVWKEGGIPFVTGHAVQYNMELSSVIEQ